MPNSKPHLESFDGNVGEILLKINQIYDIALFFFLMKSGKLNRFWARSFKREVVNQALDKYDAVQTAKLDAIEGRMQNRIDIMEREKWFILVGSIAGTAVIMAFMVMPFLRHLGLLLRTRRFSLKSSQTPNRRKRVLKAGLLKRCKYG